MSAVCRLRRLFNAKPSITKPISVPVCKNEDETAQRFRSMVDNFKMLSESSRNFRRRSAVYETAVRRLAKAKQFSMIEEILEAQKKYGDISKEGFVIRLIKLYGYAGMYDHAQAMFDEMPKFNCQRTVKSFNALLTACVNSKKLGKVEEILREWPSKLSIKPDVVTYNIVIGAFCAEGSLDLALSMLDEMERNGIDPNLVTINTLLEAFYDHGYEKGEKIWALMRSRNLVPDVWSYNSRLRGMIRDDRISEAVQLIDEMRLNGIKPDVYSYNALITFFCRDSKMDEAKNWYDELVKNENTPDSVTYNTLIPFLCKESDFDTAVEICKAALGEHKLLLSVAKLKLVIRGLLSKGMIEEAEKLVELGRKRLKIDLPPHCN